MTAYGGLLMGFESVRGLAEDEPAVKEALGVLRKMGIDKRG